MKNILNNQKLNLFFTVVLIIIVFSAYLKSSDFKLSELYQTPEQSENELVFNQEEKESNQKNQKAVDIEKNKVDSKNEIKELALISEIKDPFKADLESSSRKNPKKKERAKLENEKIKKKIESDQKLLFLEKNIIAEKLLKNKTAEIDLQTAETAADDSIKNKKREKSQPKKRDNLKMPGLSFKLMGIIKNKDCSSALFLYQGQTIIKKEKDSIGGFLIKEIKNKEIIISYQQAEQTVYLWEDKKNENEN
ncbi:MAG: hypothetical protein ACOCXB_01890 [Halanaerobium sp.]